MRRPIRLEQRGHGVPPDKAAELRRLEQLADLLDSRFLIPGTDIRIGIDPLIGLVPGVGDAITLAIGLYIVDRARHIGVPRHIRMRMLGNLAADLLVGSVPVVGDAFDFAFRANRRNIALIRRWFGRSGGDVVPLRDE